MGFRVEMCVPNNDGTPRYKYWRVVWLYYWDEWDKSQIATCLRLHRDTVSRIIDRFDSTGDVATWQGERHAAPHNQKLTIAQELELMDRIIDNPQFMLCEQSMGSGIRPEAPLAPRASRRSIGRPRHLEPDR